MSEDLVIPHGMEYPGEPWLVPSPGSGRAKNGHSSSEGEEVEEVIGRNKETAKAKSESIKGFSRTTNDQRRTTVLSKHRVLGRESAPRRDWSDLENVVVDVEITDWPSATQNARGRVVEIVGSP